MDLKLDPEPTFKAKVGIPVPGGAAVDVEFTFKWRSKDELDAFLKHAKETAMDNVKYVLEVAVAWQLNDAFTPENIARLCQKYQGAPYEIGLAYTRELIGARLKN